MESGKLQGSYGVWKSIEKEFGHFPSWIRLEKTFFVRSFWKKKLLFQTSSFNIIFIFYSRLI